MGLTFQMEEPPTPDDLDADLRYRFGANLPQRAGRRPRPIADVRTTSAPAPERHTDPGHSPRRRVCPQPVPMQPDPLPSSQHSSWLHRALRRHWLPLVGGMLLLLVLWYACATYVLPFVQDTQHHWQYGDARLSQVDLNVGHGGTSHFLALDLHGSIIVIEFPLKDPKQAHSYVAGYITDDGRPHVVTLSAVDVNQDGRPDLLVQVEGLSIPYVLYNDGHGFTITTPLMIQNGGK
ncbi:MAG: hypothetical protein H0W02_01920 [Ktedonobacteraceae bacterium]|nr:hypothetical protein [Ktedonobacteraceae bacterium]